MEYQYKIGDTKMLAINSLAVPVVTYTLYVEPEYDSKGKFTEKSWSCWIAIIHHRKTNARFWLELKLGIIQFEISCKTTTFGLANYRETSSNWVLNLVESLNRHRNLQSVINESMIFWNEVRDIRAEHHFGGV